MMFGFRGHMLKIRLKHVCSFLLIMLVIVTTGCSSQAEKTTRLWVEKNTVKVSHSVFFGGFLDPMHGATVGYHGTTYTTSDGGATWTKGSNEANCRYGLDWLDDKYLWTVGNYGGNRVSLNGGLSLFAVSDQPLIDEIPINLVDIVNMQTVWIGASNQLAVTKDAGFTFTSVSLPEEMKALSAISFISSDSGMILDATGKLYETVDGGATWTMKAELPLSYEVLVNEIPAASMRFDAERNGTIALMDKDRELLSYYTDDQCQSFVPILVDKTERGMPYISKDKQTLTLTDYLGQLTVYQLTQP